MTLAFASEGMPIRMDRSGPTPSGSRQVRVAWPTANRSPRIGLREFRSGVSVLARHLRNARGRPDRLWWVLRRMVQIAVSGKLASVLQRHVILDDLYADYPDWIARYDTLDDAGRSSLRERISTFRCKPRFSILMPTCDSNLADLTASIASVYRQIYSEWELCIVDDGSVDLRVPRFLRDEAARDPRIKLVLLQEKRGIAVATNAALSVASGDLIAFLDHDDVLSEQALFRMAEAIDARPDAVLLYSDEDKIDAAGRRYAPHFKPNWNPEWAKTTNYALHLCVVKTVAARAVGGMRAGLDGAQDWDFQLRIVEQFGDAHIIHVPRVLYHWRVREGSTAAGVNQKRGLEATQRRVLNAMLERRELAADVEYTLAGWWIRYRLPELPPLVSIVIPTRDHSDLLRRCVESVRDHTGYPNFELLIIDHDSSEPGARALLAELAASGRATVVPYAGRFNYSAECNLGVRHARGSVIVLLNNDVEVISPWWLDELVGHALQPGVGAVGASLLYRNDTIQHAGVVLGVNGTADRPYLGYRRGYAGVAGRAQAAQNVTGMITACAAVRRDRYQEVGGMDEMLAVCYNDLDLCLRFVERGYRNVWTPHAELYHLESGSRGYENSPLQLAEANRQRNHFLARWGSLACADPYYNPNLTDKGRLYSLAFPPRVGEDYPIAGQRSVDTRSAYRMAGISP